MEADFLLGLVPDLDENVWDKFSLVVLANDATDGDLANEAIDAVIGDFERDDFDALKCDFE